MGSFGTKVQYSTSILLPACLETNTVFSAAYYQLSEIHFSPQQYNSILLRRFFFLRTLIALFLSLIVLFITWEIPSPLFSTAFKKEENKRLKQKLKHHPSIQILQKVNTLLFISPQRKQLVQLTFWLHTLFCYLMSQREQVIVT